MGPVQVAGELQSDYRFRYARYCRRWVVGLGLPLLVFVVWAPSVDRSPAPLVTMFLYFGLPLGTGTAVLAALGFSVGGWFSWLAERSTANARLLKRAKVTVVSLLLAPVCAFSLYLGFRGLLTQEIETFSKSARHLVKWSAEPEWYVVHVTLWIAVGLGGLAFLLRKLREAFATS